VVTVRSARPDDQATLRALWADLDGLHAALAAGFFQAGGAGQEGGPVELREGALRGLRPAGDAALLIAEDDGRPLGALYATLQDTPRQKTLRARRRLHVETVVVDAAERRRGVGRALMTAAERWGRGRGAEQVVLTVWQGNGAAADFYRSLGYAAVSQVLAREL